MTNNDPKSLTVWNNGIRQLNVFSCGLK